MPITHHTWFHWPIQIQWLISNFFVSHVYLMLSTCSDCVFTSSFLCFYCGWVHNVVKSFSYLSVLSVLVFNISDFVVLQSPSRYQVFYFENWPDAPCHFTVWLPVWLDLHYAELCADRYTSGTVLKLSWSSSTEIYDNKLCVLGVGSDKNNEISLGWELTTDNAVKTNDVMKETFSEQMFIHLNSLSSWK